MNRIGDRRDDRDSPGAERVDLRAGAERRVRAAWERGPGTGLRAAAALYGLAAGLRDLAYDAGLAGTVAADVAVLSVGSLAVGGSGKTPVAARAARWALSAGASPAVVTPGFADELSVHRFLNPEVPTLGMRDRARAVDEVSRRGANLVILDDGFQHRRLERDLDWVVLDEHRLRAGRWRLLPAGPGRDRWGALARADGLILSRRVARSGSSGDEGGRPLADRIGREFPAAEVARCELRPGPLTAVNARAEQAVEPQPRVAFASVMKGEDFLHALGERRPEIAREYLFPDHHPVTDDRLDEMVRVAGRGGLVGTRKDVVKVQQRVAERTPLWCASERLTWTRGASGLRRQLAGLRGDP